MVTTRREPMAPACHLDHMTDVLHGLNVRHWNYLDLDAQAKLLAERKVERDQGYPWENFEPQRCWVVYVYDDGLDYDLDGNAYWDSPPEDVPVSYHLTQKGAEQEAAYMEHAGTQGRRIHVSEGWQERWHYDKRILP